MRPLFARGRRIETDGRDRLQPRWARYGPGGMANSRPRPRLRPGTRGARARLLRGPFFRVWAESEEKKNTAGLAGLPRVLCTAGPLLASGLQGVRCAGRARVKRAKIGRTTQFAQFFLFFLFPETIIDAF